MSESPHRRDWYSNSKLGTFQFTLLINIIIFKRRIFSCWIHVLSISTKLSFKIKHWKCVVFSSKAHTHIYVYWPSEQSKDAKNTSPENSSKRARELSTNKFKPRGQPKENKGTPPTVQRMQGHPSPMHTSPKSWQSPSMNTSQKDSPILSTHEYKPREHPNESMDTFH